MPVEVEIHTSVKRDYKRKLANLYNNFINSFWKWNLIIFSVFCDACKKSMTYC